MAVALAATMVFVQPTPLPPRRTSILEPLKALRHRGLATMSVTALLYNWGFFTLLAYTPFPMHLGIHQLGYVFTGWGILVAFFAAFVAPRAQARLGTPRALYINLACWRFDLVVITAFTSSQVTLIVAVIVSGAFVGLSNTLTTQAVMLVAPAEKPVASAAYGFVRFIGGGLAPFVASKLAAEFNVHVPFYLGAVTVAAAIVVLATGHTLLTRAERGPAEELSLPDPATLSQDAATAVSHLEPIVRRAVQPGEGRPIVAAIGAGSHPDGVTDAATDFARLLDRPAEILHVIETDVLKELAIDLETPDAARAVVTFNVDRLREAGVPGAGHLIRVVSGDGGAGRHIAEFADSLDAEMIIIGTAYAENLIRPGGRSDSVSVEAA